MREDLQAYWCPCQKKSDWFGCRRAATLGLASIQAWCVAHRQWLLVFGDAKFHLVGYRWLWVCRPWHLHAAITSVDVGIIEAIVIEKVRFGSEGTISCILMLSREMATALGITCGGWEDDDTSPPVVCMWFSCVVLTIMAMSWKIKISSSVFGK
jgi:hypothetical protein